MSKEIDKLIEQVLAEKGKIKVKDIGLDDFEIFDKDSNAPYGTKQNNRANWRKLGISPGRGDEYEGGPQRKNVISLQKQDSKPPATLNKTDIEAFVDANIEYFKGNENAYTDDTKKAASAINLILKQGDPKIAKFIKDTINNAVLGKPQLNAKEVEAVIGRITSIIGSSKIPQDNTRADLDPTVDAFSAPQNLPRRSLEIEEEWFDAGNFADASPALVNLFSSIEGNSIKDKLNNIAEFSGYAASGDINDWAEGRSEFDAFLYSKVLAMFADLLRSTGAPEGGFEFERWMALMLNLPVAGGEQKASDNLGKIASTANPPAKDKTIFTSAKLYKYLQGPKSPSQETQSLMNTTVAPIGEEGAESILYFAGLKKYIPDDQRAIGADGKKIKAQGLKWIEKVDMYLIQIYQEKDKDGAYLVGRFIDSDGKPSHSKPWRLVTKDKISSEGAPTQSVLTPAGREGELDIDKHKFATIWLPGGEITTEALTTAARYLTSEIETKLQSKPVTQAILSAALKIKRLEANADSYASQAKQQKGGGTAYISKITDDYLDLENLYDQIFSYGERESEDKKYVNPARQQRPAVNESRSSLDQLIETIIKQTLLK